MLRKISTTEVANSDLKNIRIVRGQRARLKAKLAVNYAVKSP
jgi:hypothetical protein